jgi:hypothetical protein
MGSICREEGLDACAEALAAKITAYLECNQPPSLPPAGTDTASPASSNLWAVPADMHPPMDHQEKLRKERVYGEYRRRQFPKDHASSKVSHRQADAWPRDAVGLMSAIALELGLPLNLLLEYQAYYTYRSFIFDTQSRQVYLCVIFSHHDEGGLAEIPVRLCSFAEAAENRLLGLLRYRLGAEIYNREYKAWHSAQNYAKNKSRAGGIIDAPQIPSSPEPQAFEALGHGKSVEQVVQAKLFGDREITHDDIGRKLSFLFESENTKSPKTGYALLNRIATCRCADTYSPLIAGVFAGRSSLGSNHFNIQDLFDARNRAPSSLVDLIGKVWAPNVNPQRSDLSKTQIKGLRVSVRDLSRQELLSLFDLGADRVEEHPGIAAQLRKTLHGLSAADWSEIFPQKEEGRRRTLPDRVAESVRKSASLSIREAETISVKFGAFLRIKGKLSLSKPLPYLNSEKLSQLVVDASHLIGTTYFPRNKAGTEISKRASPKKLQSDLKQLVKIISETRMRPKEARTLYANDVLQDPYFSHYVRSPITCHLVQD